MEKTAFGGGKVGHRTCPVQPKCVSGSRDGATTASRTRSM